MEKILTKYIIEDLYKVVDMTVDFLQRMDASIEVDIIMGGNNPSSESYVGMKREECEKHGINCNVIHYDVSKESGNISKEDYNDCYKRIVRNSGFIPTMIQLPFPHPGTSFLLNSISSDIDVDGLSEKTSDRLRPCTAAGIRMILKRYKIDVTDKNVVVVGRSKLLGEPMSEMLIKDNANVTILHSKTSKDNLKKYCLNADIIISTTGQHDLITEDMVSEGVILIDTGFSRVDGKIRGDINEKCWNKASLYTPYTNCIGPLTIAILLFNIVFTNYESCMVHSKEVDKAYNHIYHKYDLM